MTEDKPAKSRPKFKRKDTRVKVALAKYYGTGDEDPWTMEEIADYLNVSKRKVNEYINHSDIGEEVEEKLAEAQARTRMEVALKLMNSLEDLEEMESQLREEKRPAVVSHRPEKVKARIKMNKDGMKVVDDREVSVTVPVPEHFKEVPEVTGDLKDIMREKRMVIERINNLLGLDAPDKIESEHREIKMEKKVWDLNMEESGFPEQEVLEGDDDVVDIDAEFEDKDEE